MQTKEEVKNKLEKLIKEGNYYSECYLKEVLTKAIFYLLDNGVDESPLTDELIADLKKSLSFTDFMGVDENGVAKPIHLSYSVKDGVIKEGSSGALGLYYPSFDMGFGTYKPDNLSQRDKSYNVWFGYRSLSNIKNVKYTTAYGSLSGQKLLEGEHISLLGLNALGRAPLAKNFVAIGSYAGYSTTFGERLSLEEITRHTPVINEVPAHFKKSILDLKEDGTINPNSGVVMVGNGVFESGPTRHSTGVFIGNYIGNSGWVHRNYNNIFIGTYFVPQNANIQVFNSMFLGAFLSFRGNPDNVFSVHQSKSKITDIEDALLYGKFEERFLKINGSFQINPTYNNATANPLYTKDVVAMPNGTLGLVDRVVNKVRKFILKNDVEISDESQELQDLSFNLEAGKTYKISVYLLRNIDMSTYDQLFFGYFGKLVSSDLTVQETLSDEFSIETSEDTAPNAGFYSTHYDKPLIHQLGLIIPKNNLFVKFKFKRYIATKSGNLFTLKRGSYIEVEEII